MDSDHTFGTAAELRRTQLVQVAKEIILNEGIEALRHAAIAKKAGVTRALIYRYFPKQSDFFVAISDEFIVALKQRLSVDDQIEAVQLSLGNNHAAADRYFDAVFSVLEDKGPASLMLLAEPDLSPKLSNFLGNLQTHHYYDWLHQRAGVNLSPIDTHVRLARQQPHRFIRSLSEANQPPLLSISRER